MPYIASWPCGHISFPSRLSNSGPSGTHLSIFRPFWSPVNLTGHQRPQRLNLLLQLLTSHPKVLASTLPGVDALQFTHLLFVE
jgi:hypothetical protein